MVVLGIDPGLSGALAVVERGAKGVHVEVHDMPVIQTTVAGKSRNRIDLVALADLVADLAVMSDIAIVEDLAGRPSTVIGKGGQRIAQRGLFEQGWNCAAPVVSLIHARVPFQMVTPQVWKRRLKVPSDKRAAKVAADRLFPEHRDLWRLVKHDGRAEAALIAQYHFEVNQ